MPQPHPESDMNITSSVINSTKQVAYQFSQVFTLFFSYKGRIAVIHKRLNFKKFLKKH